MTLKYGVSIIGIRAELVLGLMVADGIYNEHQKELMVTSCVDSTKHMATSLHYKGLAADLRVNNIPTDVEKIAIHQEIKAALGGQWDVLLEGLGTPNEHIHMEFDPKTSPVT
jgi:hypothetical protein